MTQAVTEPARVGALLLEYRTALGLTQLQVARAVTAEAGVKIDQKTISRWETGVITPTLRNAIHALHVFGVRLTAEQTRE